MINNITPLTAMQIEVLKEILEVMQADLNSISNISIGSTSTLAQQAAVNHLIGEAQMLLQDMPDAAVNLNQLIKNLETISQYIDEEWRDTFSVVQAMIAELQQHFDQVCAVEPVAFNDDQTLMFMFYHKMQECRAQLYQHCKRVQQKLLEIQAWLPADSNLAKVWQASLHAVLNEYDGNLSLSAKLQPTLQDIQQHERDGNLSPPAYLPPTLQHPQQQKIINYFSAVIGDLQARQTNELMPLRTQCDEQWLMLIDKWQEVKIHLLGITPATDNFSLIYNKLATLVQLTLRLAGGQHVLQQNSALAAVLAVKTHHHYLEQLSLMTVTDQQEWVQRCSEYQQQQAQSNAAVAQILAEVLDQWHELAAINDAVDFNADMSPATIKLIKNTQRDIVAEFLVAINALLLVMKKNDFALTYKIATSLESMVLLARQLQSLGARPKIQPVKQEFEQGFVATQQHDDARINNRYQCQIQEIFHDIQRHKTDIHGLMPTLYGTIKKMAWLAKQALPELVGGMYEYSNIINEFLQTNGITLKNWSDQEQIEQLCHQWELNLEEWDLVKCWLQRKNRNARYVMDKQLGQAMIKNSLGLSLGERCTTAAIWQQAQDRELFAAEKLDKLVAQQLLWQKAAQKQTEQQQEFDDIRAMILTYLNIDPALKISNAVLKRKAEDILLNNSGHARIISFDDEVKIRFWCDSNATSKDKLNALLRQGGLVAKKYFVVNGLYTNTLLAELILHGWLQQSRFDSISFLERHQLRYWAYKTVDARIRRHQSEEKGFVMTCLRLQLKCNISDFALIELAKQALADPTNVLQQPGDRQKVTQWLEQTNQAYTDLRAGGEKMIAWFCNLNTHISHSINGLIIVAERLLQRPDDFVAVLSERERQYLQDWIVLVKFTLKYHNDLFCNQRILQNFTDIKIVKHEFLVEQLARQAHHYDFSWFTSQDWRQIKIVLKRQELSNSTLVDGRRWLTAFVDDLPTAEHQRVLALMRAGKEMLENAAHPIHDQPEIKSAIQAWLHYQLCYLHFMIHYAQKKANCAQRFELNQY